VIQFWWRSGSRLGSGSPKSEIQILRIGGGLCSLSIAFLFYYGISVLLCNILTFKLLLNSIERNERKSKRTKVSTKFRRETNPSKSYINNKSRTFHNITARSQHQVPFFQCQGIGPGRTWCSAATGAWYWRVKFWW